MVAQIFMGNDGQFLLDAKCMEVITKLMARRWRVSNKKWDSCKEVQAQMGLHLFLCLWRAWLFQHEKNWLRFFLMLGLLSDKFRKATFLGPFVDWLKKLNWHELFGESKKVHFGTVPIDVYGNWIWHKDRFFPPQIGFSVKIILLSMNFMIWVLFKWISWGFSGNFCDGEGGGNEKVEKWGLWKGFISGAWNDNLASISAYHKSWMVPPDAESVTCRMGQRESDILTKYIW